MEEQHAIPQQISSYQFRLVGDMTLKQFFQVAGGLLISLLIYSTNLHVIIKWPLILLFALLGIALAFLPFQDRPLEKWILAFFKSVYSPTIYSWKREERAPVFFRDEGVAPEDKIIAPHGEVAMQKYLKETAGRGAAVFEKLEEAERAFLAKITRLFGFGGSQAKVQTVEPLPQKQKVRPEEVGKIKIPETAPTKMAQKRVVDARPKLVVEEKEGIVPTTPVSPTLSQQKTAQLAQAAQFSPQAAPPLPPERPNTISGQVMDVDGKIVEGAILEIRDIAGRPVRAVKTNKVGHFIIVTPLQNGTYEIITEKEGWVFSNISFEAKGVIIPPIAVRARKSIPVNEEEN